MKTIIAVGLYRPGTGFTKVFESIFKHLSNFYIIHWLGIGYKGPVVESEYTIHPNNLTGGDMYGSKKAAEMAIQYRASHILLLNDIYMLHNYQPYLKPLQSQGIKVVAYTPLDGYVRESGQVKGGNFVNTWVLYAQWAKKEVQHYLKDDTAPKLVVIGHGVELEKFKPIDDNSQKNQLRAKWFGVLPEDAIIILNANRYNERKNLEGTLKAFGTAFKHFNKPTYLCLHTPGVYMEKLKKLKEICFNHPTSESIFLNPTGNDYVDEESLVHLYQICDIGVNSSYGEGWGLIAYEHAACAGAQIVPGHSTPAEEWMNQAVIIPATNNQSLWGNPFDMKNIDLQILSSEMIKLVNQDQYRKEIQTRCLSHTQHPKYRWENIAYNWRTVFD